MKNALNLYFYNYICNKLFILKLINSQITFINKTSKPYSFEKRDLTSNKKEYPY